MNGWTENVKGRDVWVGAFGKYDVPSAISNLAAMAQRRTGREYKTHIGCWQEPYFKVVEEWGLWRDQQEQQAWEAKP